MRRSNLLSAKSRPQHARASADKQAALFEKLIDLVLTRWRGRLDRSKSETGTDIRQFGLHFLNGFLLLAATFKHLSFAEEKEWRLVDWRSAMGSDRLQFREGRGGIVPYVELPLRRENDLQIESITVGPAPHVQLAENAVVSFLMTNPVGFRTVDVSKTPYRPW